MGVEHAQHFREATHSPQCKIKLEKGDLAGILFRDLMSLVFIMQ